MRQRTLYEILMVDVAADMGIITLVYHALAKRYHPDRTSVPDADQRMVEINTAHAVLCDPERRAAYDRSIGVSAERAMAREPVAISIETEVSQGTAPTPAHPESASPYGEAGQPPPYPLPSGSVLTFGRYRGWAISQIDGYDQNYLEWLRRTPTGRAYTAEIDAYLKRHVTA